MHTPPGRAWVRTLIVVNTKTAVAEHVGRAAVLIAAELS